MSIYDARFILIYCIVVAALFGAVMGSFLNCAAWRIAHREPWWKGRSHCPSCGHSLGPLDLFPVLSWLALRGKCRYCGTRISPRYPLTELCFAALTVGCLLRFDLTVLCLRNYVLLCGLFCLSLVDLECFEIPDGCLLVGLGAWLLALPFLRPGWRAALWSLLAGLIFGGGLLLVSLALDRVLKKESLGGGDVKLFALMGLYLGLVGAMFATVMACALGLVPAILRRRGGGEERIPFGPAIAAAFTGMLFFGEGLTGWYLGLLGL